MHVELWAVDRPIASARNARRIPDAALDQVAASIKRIRLAPADRGGRPGRNYCGSDPFARCQEAGSCKVPVHVAQGLTPAQVKPTGSWIRGPDLLLAANKL